MNRGISIEITDQIPPTRDVNTDDDHQTWLVPLAGTGSGHDQAVKDLHGLLLRASRFEIRRRARAMGCDRDPELDDLAVQAANDALVAVLAKLDDFAGRSRFTTWAYKFAINIAGVAVRRHVWGKRQLPLPAQALDHLSDLTADPAVRSEERDLLAHIAAAVAQLTPHQRSVLVSLAVDGVPIDVLAARLSTNRNALYKTLHDARRRVRALLNEKGITP